MAYYVSEVKARANSLLQETLGPSGERIRSTLRDLGFSGHAADAFYALVRISHATAGDLVVKTGIPDSKIYYALDELAEKGIVEVQEGKPKTYRVVPAKEVEIRLSRLVEADYERRPAADLARTTDAVRTDILGRSSNGYRPNRSLDWVAEIRCDTRSSGPAKAWSTWEAAAESTCSWLAASSVLQGARPGLT